MPNLSLFRQKLESSIQNDLPAKALAERIILAALESEYGRGFTLNRGFAKMVHTLAEAVVVNPELRRQTLTIASFYLNNKNDT